MRRLLAGLIVASLGTSGVAAQEGDGARADQTVAKILPLVEHILDIEGLSGNTEGEIVSLDAAASDLASRDDTLTVRRTDKGLRVAMKGDILFSFDDSAIQPAAAKTLSALAEVVRKAGRGPVIVEGHTDSKGTHDYNRALSERRAEAVVDWLVGAEDFEPAIFVAKGRGSDDPVAPNTRPDGRDNPNGRRQNRRVEFVFPGKDGPPDR